jgi:hypothetical protein
MGIARGTVRVLMSEGNRRPFKGSALTLGRQDIHISWRQFVDIAKAAKFGLPAEHAERNERQPDINVRKIDDRILFKMLGFDDVASLDVSSYENADLIWDLNKVISSEDLINKFDVIVDGGTIEHVFHLPNALFNIFKMLKVGGRVIHLSPSSNHIDHGFYMFSPTLFHDFYLANKFEINTIMLFRYNRRNSSRWVMMKYEAGSLDLGTGILDDQMYGIAVVATKTEASTGETVPQQRIYSRTGSEDSTTYRTDGRRALTRSRNGGPRTLAHSIHEKIKALPWLDSFCMELYLTYFHKVRGVPLDVVGRY